MPHIRILTASHGVSPFLQVPFHLWPGLSVSVMELYGHAFSKSVQPPFPVRPLLLHIQYSQSAMTAQILSHISRLDSLRRLLIIYKKRPQTLAKHLFPVSSTNCVLLAPGSGMTLLSLSTLCNTVSEATMGCYEANLSFRLISRIVLSTPRQTRIKC